MLIFYNFIDNQAVPYLGQPPYIHWVGPFSTGIYRYKSLYFRCDNPDKRVQAKIITQPTNICYIYDGAQTTDWQLTADTLKREAILTPSQGDWYQLILVVKSELAGEYLLDISINGQIYKVGCEFHGENEALSIGLINKGLELPPIVAKSLYDSDLLEEKSDWILLNRKYRELLMNYMDLLANKGSYKSLIQSLKWFDYGKLVELREVWRYETPDGTKLFDVPIQAMLTDEVKRNLFNCAKTTYFALRHPLKIVGTNLSPQPELIDTIYEWDPLQFIDLRGNHSLEALACKWSEEEMRMKMVLLGNFFETYFMPIHSNLIRSVVEDIHSYSLSIGFCGSDSYHDECFTEAGDFELDWGDGTDPQNPETSGQSSSLILPLKVVHVLAGVPRDEPYGTAFENTQVSPTVSHYIGLPHIPMVACHEIDEDNVKFETADFNQFKAAYSQQIFNGLGAVGVGSFKFQEKIVSGTCDTNVHGDFIRTSFKEKNASDKFIIRFLFQRPGDYIMIFNFVGESGRHYTKRVNAKIINNMKPDIDIYVLKARCASGEEVPNPFETHPDEWTEPANRFMFARTKPIDYEVVKDDSYRIDYSGQPTYTQYIPMRPYKDQTNPAPDDAPYKTRLFTTIFKGANCYNLLQNFMSSTDNHNRLFKTSTWYRIGYETPIEQNKSRWCWIQYIYKVRGEYGEFPHANATDYYYKEVFIPELMTLSIPERTVSGHYPIVCVPVIKLYTSSDNQNVVEKVPYSFYVDEQQMTSAWEFFSWNIQQNINDRLESIDEPFVGWKNNQPIPRGHYTIKFKYDFGDGPKEIVKNAPFKYTYGD